MAAAAGGGDPEERVKVFTLVVVTTEDYSQVLLGMKKRGFGQGKWNGFGGKLEPGESVEAAAVRELREESGLSARRMEKRGMVQQKFVGDPVALEFHVFHVVDYDGELTESDEMAPKWFAVEDIPYAQMWRDDEEWYPFFLNEMCFRGFLLFRGTESMLGCTMEEVSPKDLESYQDWGKAWRREAELGAAAGLRMEGTIFKENDEASA
mmetsp:Transcript_123408/g.394828  ORF Transcript_123408/g.394828 Transcript_123408/m.394828 type:complete len:208 (+) Transcript_123408:3-626(+)|eukprot:CAMPEP_0204147624 /NCGR_PEP_ID=MMETSP0361-20130328/22903_1 /ASSEMBLY_ACC=CAM_ASM_000343 /TAXON_ID=268821 /ORGANISM="Scrippsiella Hangoei, Strain SHTV-5" /LENGTH=207 /DNA_ID=CAMNT_0051101845 /DNA_START=1 /DNA_END=624 /DNA_ORIENTATION=-